MEQEEERSGGQGDGVPLGEKGADQEVVVSATDELRLSSQIFGSLSNIDSGHIRYY